MVLFSIVSPLKSEGEIQNGTFLLAGSGGHLFLNLDVSGLCLYHFYAMLPNSK